MLFSRIKNELLSLCCLSLLIIQAIGGSIQGTIQLPESPQRLKPLNSTLVTLNDGEYSTYTTSSTNSFTFHNIPPGVHVLDVHCHTYHYSQIKIQIPVEETATKSETETIIDLTDLESIDNAEKEAAEKLAAEAEGPKCIEYVYPGAPKRSISHPLTLIAHAEYQYFQPRPSFSPFVMFKNPMVLMALFSVAMMVIMPQMMKGLDPEQKQQMKKQMEMQSDPQKMLSSLWGDISGKKEVTAVEKKVIKKERPRMKRE